MPHLFFYLTVFAAAFGEASAFVGLLVPGVGVVLGAGVLAARGGADPLWVGLLASLGSVAGFGVSYRLGQVGGPRVTRWGRRFGGAADRARTFFERHGAWGVFLGHFFGPVRALVAFTAGAAGLPPRRFWPASVAGGAVWGFGLTLSGVALSGGWALVETWLGRASLLLALVAALLYLAFRLVAGFLLLGLRLLPPAAETAAELLSKAAASPALEGLSRRLPGMAAWTLRRLSPRRATGLVLSCGVLACLAFGWLFFGVAEDLLFHDPLVRVDRHVFHLLQALRTGEADRVFLVATYLGSGPVLLATTVAAVLSLAWLRRGFEAGLLAASFTLAQGLVWALKLGVGRDRPAPLAPLTQETTAAFPSNHAFASVALYGFLAYVAARALKAQGRARCYAAAALLIAGVGLSRLYLGVHWVSDVAAGYAMGGIWLSAVITAAEVRRQFGPPRAFPPAFRRRLAAVAVALCLVGAQAQQTARELPRDLSLPRRPPHQALLGATELAAAVRSAASTPVETLLGRPLGKPGAVLVGDAQAIVDAAREAGWIPARSLGLGVLLGEALRALTGRSDPAAPLSPAFWEGRPQELGLAAPEGRGRRTARLWRTGHRLAGGDEVWVTWERLQGPPRRFLGLHLPASSTPVTPGMEKLPAALEKTGRFRAAGGEDRGAKPLRVLTSTPQP